MASHLSSVGLPVASEAEFWDLAQRVGPLAQGIPVNGGQYFFWRDGSGAELWLQVADGDQFLGMAPHFTGDSEVVARLDFRVPSGDGSPFDGALRATALTDDDEFPFVFDSPEYLRLERLDLPCEVALQVAAFAHELEVFDSEDAFIEARQANAAAGTPTLRPRYFAHSGRLEDGPDDLSESRAIFNGVVLASEECGNGLTGRRFTWALVECNAGTFDVVADATVLPLPPQVGAVISGSFWLSARVRVE